MAGPRQAEREMLGGRWGVFSSVFSDLHFENWMGGKTPVFPGK